MLYFYSFTLSPFLAYLIWQAYHLRLYPIWGIFAIALLFLNALFIRRKLRFPKYVIPLGLLGIYYIISEYSFGYISEIGILRYIYRSWVPFTIASLILIENTTFSQEFIENIIIIFKITIIISFIASVIQLFFYPNFFLPDYLIDYNYDYNPYNIRNPSIFGATEDNELGFSFLPIAFIVIGWSIRHRRFMIPWCFFSIIVLLGSNSRWIFVGVLFLIFYIFQKKRFDISILYQIIFLTFFVLCFVMVYIDVSSFTFEQYKIERLLSKTAFSRIAAFKEFGSFFAQKPYFGYGQEIREVLIRDILRPKLHVGYLSHLVGYGLIGSGLLFYSWFLILKHLFQVGKKYNAEFLSYFFVFFLAANWTMPQYSLFSYGFIFIFVFAHYISANEKTATKRKYEKSFRIFGKQFEFRTSNS